MVEGRHRWDDMGLGNSCCVGRMARHGGGRGAEVKTDDGGRDGTPIGAYSTLTSGSIIAWMEK